MRSLPCGGRHVGLARHGGSPWLAGVQTRTHDVEAILGVGAFGAGGDAAAPDAPSAVTAPRESDAGVDEHGAARRGQAGDELADDAAHLAGVQNAGEHAQLATHVGGGERLPAHDLRGGGVEREHRARARMPGRRLLDEGGHRTSRPLGQPQGQGHPARRLGGGSRVERVEVERLALAPCPAALAFGAGRAGGRARRAGPGRRSRRRRLVAGHPVQQIVGPLVGHDGTGEREHYQDGRAPEPDGVVPVEVTGPPAQPHVEDGHGPHRRATPRARPP